MLTVEVILSVGGNRRYWRPSELLDIPRGRSPQPGLESQPTVYRALSSWVDEAQFVFFPTEWKFPGCCGAVAGRMLMAEPCPWPRVGGSAVTVVVTVLAAITVVRWLLLPSSLSWFSTVSISHMRAEKRSLLVPNPPALRPRRPCLICWHLASPGNILPTYFSRIFLKSSAS